MVARSQPRSERIVQEAVRLFAARGFGATSIDDIGAAAGVSGPAIYWHFTGKQALLASMLIDVSERLLDGGRRSVAEATSGDDAIARLIDVHVDFALREPDLIVVHGRELHHLDPSDAHRVRLLQRQYLEVWVDVLEEQPNGPEAGRSRPQLGAAAQAVIGLINSTPYLPSPDRDALAPMLAGMARAALATLEPTAA